MTREPNTLMGAGRAFRRRFKRGGARKSCFCCTDWGGGIMDACREEERL